MTLNCLTCENTFYAKPSHVARGNSKYCSRACHGLSQRGREVSAEWREKLGRATRGKKKTPEHNAKNSAANLGRPKPAIQGERHYAWKGGVCPETMVIRHSAEYRDWRRRVFQRDRWNCQACGNHSNKLHADHVMPFSSFKDLRFEVLNGRTMCVPCHRKTDTYGWRGNLEKHPFTQSTFSREQRVGLPGHLPVVGKEGAPHSARESKT